MVHEAAIRTELEGLRARLREVTGAIAATTDGLLLAADAPGVQAEGFAALTAAALGVGLRLADSAGQQSMRELLVRCDSGCVVLHAAGRDAVLAVLAGPRANVGRIAPGGPPQRCPAGRAARRRSRGAGGRRCAMTDQPPRPRAGRARSRAQDPAKEPTSSPSPRTHRNTPSKGSTKIMANTETALKDAMTSIEGVIGVALVDYTSGMALGTLGGGKDLDLSVAAAAATPTSSAPRPARWSCSGSRTRSRTS